jgi:hypothetical protein
LAEHLQTERTGVRLAGDLRPQLIALRSQLKLSELADAILIYSVEHHRDTKNVKIRVVKIADDFGDRVADSIKPEEIVWLDEEEEKRLRTVMISRK